MMTEHRGTVRQPLALHIDCETTGLGIERDQVIEAAMPRPDDVVAIVHHHGGIEDAAQRRCAGPRRALRRRARVTPARGIHRDGDLFPATLRQGARTTGVAQ